MQKIIGTVTKAPSTLKNDDDFIDRLSHRYTVLIMVVFAFVVSTALYVGSPITCWVPKHFTGSHTKYTNSYCWVKNTYYLPYEEEIPKAHEDDKRQTIIYYQWMPFIMLLQAVFFYIPSAVWHGLNQKAGVDCDNILESALKYQEVTQKKVRGHMLHIIVKQMDRFLMTRKDRLEYNTPLKMGKLITSCGCICGPRLGNYLVILYLISKVLYIANVLGQLFVLNEVLATHYSLYGYEFITNVIHDEAWATSYAFPRVTMCDFLVRRLGNIHRYTVQCVLPINMYTEKIYAFLWFWYVFVAAASVLSFVLWLARILIPQDRYSYIVNHLRIDEKLKEGPSGNNVQKFINNYLRQDGVFVIRLIGHNTNNITATEVTGALWERWMEIEANRELDGEYSGELEDSPKKPLYPDPNLEKSQQY